MFICCPDCLEPLCFLHKDDDDCHKLSRTTACTRTSNVTNSQLNEKSVQISEPGNKEKQRGRKRVADPQSWTRISAKAKKQRGEAYQSFGKDRKVIPPKRIASDLCTCKRKCTDKIDKQGVEALFRGYYSQDTNDKKNSMLFRFIKKTEIQRPKTHALKPRMNSFRYVVPNIVGDDIVVCKTAFTKIFDISRDKIDHIKQMMVEGHVVPVPDARGKHKNRPHAYADDSVEVVRNHIESYPAEVSHYSRHKNPRRKYLSSSLSQKRMYNHYVEKCSDKGLIPVKFWKFSEIFRKQYNIGFGGPRSDTCAACDAFDQIGDVENKEKHLIEAENAYQEMKFDRERAKEGEVEYIVYDLEKTLPLPNITTSIVFYTRQLWLYNLIVHFASRAHENGYFHVWTEDKAGRGSDEILSCLLSFFLSNSHVFKSRSLVVYSDSCGGQNKNRQTVYFWYYLIHSLNLFDSVEHKFPIVGHTYNDADRDASVVECAVRRHVNDGIYTAEKYKEIFREAKHSNKFNICDMSGLFQDMSPLGNDKIHGFSKDVDGNNVEFQKRVGQYCIHTDRPSLGPIHTCK